jgi:hypothetical protein
MVRSKSSTARGFYALLFALSALFCAGSLARANSVTTDYSRSIDFTRFQTFMWLQAPDCVDPGLRQKIVAGINAQLESKGLYLVDRDADLGVSANIATAENHTLRSFYEDFPECWNWQHYMGPGSTIKVTDMEKADTFKLGTLVVDLFDVDKRQVIWWSAANKFAYETAPKGPKHVIPVFDEMFGGNQWWTTTP